MARTIAIVAAAAVLAQFAYAENLNECLSTCLVTYNKCLEDRNPMEQCQLTQRNCEQQCREH